MNNEISEVRTLYYPVRSDQYARIGHRVITIDNQIFVFGGVSPNYEYNSSIIKIDTETMTLDLVNTIKPFKLQGFSLFLFNK